jgi:hypothetical protein
LPRLTAKDVFGQAYGKIHAGAAPDSTSLPNVGLPRLFLKGRRARFAETNGSLKQAKYEPA